MNILVTGQCTLHLGRMEFGNIGNYYVIEPLFRELHRVFPRAEIRTTFQMSADFSAREHVTILPMDLFYGWNERDLDSARKELELSQGLGSQRTAFMRQVLRADLVIDFSGDLWGDNADLAGTDRFAVGLLKDEVAQNLGTPTVMIAGSPGPFKNPEQRDHARRVYEGFDLVTNREPVSTRLLDEAGFDVSRTQSLACPAFLFEGASRDVGTQWLAKAGVPIGNGQAGLVGFALCGWNFPLGPFDRWPRHDDEYENFVRAVAHVRNETGASVLLLSHANGFRRTQSGFSITNGRDYPILQQLRAILRRRGLDEGVYLLDEPLVPRDMKALLGMLDMLVTGRVHAAIAGLSQGVPTVIIDYGHEPKAHKLVGFAEVAGVSDYVADPEDSDSLISIIERCWNQRSETSKLLSTVMPTIKATSRMNFDLLADIL